jgi:ribosomal protein S6--L-glutamate ligase
MKIAILSRRPQIYSTSRLVEAGKKRGHDIQVVDTLRCFMNINSENPSIHYKGKLLPAFDAIIPRIGASINFYGAAVVRQFEMMGVYSINQSDAITKARDKFRSLQLLSKKGIGLPITGFARSPNDAHEIVQMVGGPPLIIKLLEGTQGIGVVLAETKNTAESVIEAFLGHKANILIQEYIQEAKGADLRCFVVGKKVVAAIRRQAVAGEFRANIHRGGKAEVVTLSEEEHRTALRVAQLVGLNVAGIDIIRSKRGPLVLEINASPGLEGVEKATGLDIAQMIIECIEQNTTAKKE